MMRKTKRPTITARRGFVAAATAVIALLLSSCAGAAQPDVATAPSAVLQEELELMRAERAQAAVDCLADNGFPGAIAYADGSTSLEVDDAQQSAYAAVSMECMKQICPNCGKPLPQASLERLYDLQIEVRACLKQEFDIDTSEPPALQTYLDAPEEQRWNPYLEAAAAMAQSGKLRAVESTCPDPISIASYW